LRFLARELLCYTAIGRPNFDGRSRAVALPVAYFPLLAGALLVRTCGSLLLALIAAGWIACRLPQAPSAPSAAVGGWRRTAEGWERPSIWRREPSLSRPPLHPILPTMLGGFVSLMAMAAFAPAARHAGRHAPPAWHMSRERRRVGRTVLVERRRSI
jgi:hypothetical protein